MITLNQYALLCISTIGNLIFVYFMVIVITRDIISSDKIVKMWGLILVPLSLVVAVYLAYYDYVYILTNSLHPFNTITYLLCLYAIGMTLKSLLFKPDRTANVNKVKRKIKRRMDE